MFNDFHASRSSIEFVFIMLPIARFIGSTKVSNLISIAIVTESMLTLALHMLILLRITIPLIYKLKIKVGIFFNKY